jgi:hypothetical protein
MINQRQHVRQLVEGPGKLAMTIIPFETLEKIDLTVDAVDRGDGGLAINAERVLEPGFVVIRDGLAERKNGVLVWIKERGDRSCRAGIQFVPTREKESERSQNEVGPGFPLPALQDPELFASLIMDVAERGIQRDR